jgi:outer membrane protein insertion porin family/translocation and assembly module TamA
VFESHVGRRDIAASGALGVALLLLTGCPTIPSGRSAIDDVTVRGTSALDEDDVEGAISTEASPKFLGLFRGVVYDYEVFDRATLQRDLARIERYYHAHGYYGAHARAGRVLTTGTGHVRVEIVVEEGPPTVNGSLTIDGLEGLPSATQDALRAAARLALPAGAPFNEGQGDQCEKAARKALTDAGYAYAAVTRDTFVDIVRHVANTSLTVSPGETARLGPITFDGVDPDGAGPQPPKVPEPTLRRAIDLKEGEPYSTERLDEASQALLDLGVFAAVTVDLSNPETRVVPVRIHVEPAKLHELSLGGGAEFDEIKTELHAIGSWEDHDFLGGLRDLSVHFQPGVVFFPTRIDNFAAPTHLFPEEKLRAELKQPGFIEARTEAFVRPELNVFPLLVQTKPNPADPVTGYREIKGAVGVDRTFWKKLYVSLSYDVQVEDPFGYKDPVDPDLSTLIISYPELVTHLDFRDDHDHPHAGVYVANDFQIAGGFLGGEARDVKIQPEVRTYIPVARKVTFATRGSLGMLFPFNYGQVIENQLNDPLTRGDRAARVHDMQTVLFRGLSSGGPTSNRGFPLRGVSPHGVVPFLNPSTASSQVAGSCLPVLVMDKPGQPAHYALPTTSQATDCSASIGGFTLWELSNEIRFTVHGPLSAATFCDMGDVSPHPVGKGQAFRFEHLHLSCGIGARYDTPVGPIRLDVGYRIQPLQVLGFSSETAAYNADPSNGLQPTILGLPIAIAVGIGEAY